MIFKKYSFILACFLLSLPSLGQAELGSLWKEVPLQHGGRVKPLDTFARDILREVYGRETFEGKSAVDIILSWLILPDHWEKTPFISIKKEKIKRALGLDISSRWYAPETLKTNRKFALQLVEIKSILQKKEELDSYFESLQKVETRLALYESIKTGWLFKLQPQQEGQPWISLSQMQGEAQKAFQKAIQTYIQIISQKHQDQSWEFSSQDKNLLKKQLDHFNRVAFKGSQKGYQPLRLQTEVFYNTLDPFKLACFLYFLFLFILLILFVWKKMNFASWLAPLVGAGFLLHSLGLILRSYIMSRPPVSNMYETVVWVPWVALLVGCIFYLKKIKVPFVASVFLAGFCLFLVNVAPEILDSRLQPLEAVLRSTFWLSTHVLIITMSYSFFFLAFVLGDIGLIYYLLRKDEPKRLVQQLFHPIYRSVQWGVLLLTLGTFLGAIWADYSWGRFWGWDPKESWALISLLGYLALLHGRFVGWVRALSFSVAVVLMFFLVIMAWYGVNFVLGKGLHSYGFGFGGFEFVLTFFILHLILCACVGLQYYTSCKRS